MMISVCMATYNGECFIKKQIDSILCQLSPDDELIISDDSSTDNTLNIIKAYNDKRILLLENNKFHTPVFNLENALKSARGDYIFLSDQDDIWYPNKVQSIIPFFGKYDCVLSDATIIDGNEKILQLSFYELNHSKNGVLYNLIKNSYIGCCMAFNKKVLDYALPFPKNIPMHDSWIGLLSEVRGKSIFLEQPLIYYRRHGNNASSTAGKSLYSFKEKIYHRFSLINNIILRLMQKH